MPYRYQKKKRLVYCDVVEHTILHALISREYSLESKGYESLKGIIYHWYVLGNLPNGGNKWELSCYHKSFLESEEATILLDFIEQKQLLT